MQCPACKSKNFTKNGFVLNKQRFKCLQCGCNFTQSRKGRLDEKLKFLSLDLYRRGYDYRTIAQVLEVSSTTVYKWVKEMPPEERMEVRKGEKIYRVPLFQVRDFLQKNSSIPPLTLLLIETKTELILMSVGAVRAIVMQFL